MLGVPITWRSNFWKRYASSLVVRVEPIPPIDCAPWRVMISLSLVAIKAKASSQAAGVSVPLRRIRGVRRRSGVFTQSKYQRPRLHSHPSSISSLLRDIKRIILSTRTSIRALQPTLQLLHTLGTCFNSHGRALKRYLLEVSAPTGQISTVLPEKTESKA